MLPQPSGKRPLPPEVASWLRAAAATEALFSALRGPDPAGGLPEQADEPGAIQVDGIRNQNGAGWLWNRLVPGLQHRRLERTRGVTRRSSDAPAA